MVDKDKVKSKEFDFLGYKGTPLTGEQQKERGDEKAGLGRTQKH